MRPLPRSCETPPPAVIDGLCRAVGLCRDAGAVALPEAVRQRARASIQQLLDGKTRTK